MASPSYTPSANCQVPDLGAKWEAIFGRRTEGFFVEVGAYDGESFSNTSCLSDAGWGGLYVEPIEEFAEKCRRRHAGNPRVHVINTAASDEAGRAEIFVGDTLTSLIGEQVADYEKIDWAKGLHRGESREITTDRLDTILSDGSVPVSFDVLVVDVEGAEEKVMLGFDVARWRPKVILIELEDEHPDFRDNVRVVSAVSSIREHLRAAGYSVYFKDHINSLHLRSDVDERVARKAPVRADPPRVSIGLPTYNRPDLLIEALESIERQSFRSFEVIVADNASPDPRVAQQSIALVERDHRFSYIRHLTNQGASANFLFTLGKATAPLFMWASDDDLWAPDFLSSAVRTLNETPSIAAWMCHLEVVDAVDSSKVIRQIPNLSKFSSGSTKPIHLARYVSDPEVLGKANLFYALFRRTALQVAVENLRPYFADWGGDMILIYAFLCRGNMKVDPVIRFSKRAAAREVNFLPTEPRRHIVPWTAAGRFYGALIAVSMGKAYHGFTKAMVRARYLYDVLYTRLKLQQPAPWLPSHGAHPVPTTDRAVAPTQQMPSHADMPTSRQDNIKDRFIQEFRDAHYVRHNQRRQEHLASLGLPLAGRYVLELGAGIGDHTTFFNDRACSICVTDGRPELYEILKERYHCMRTELLDLEMPNPDFQDVYEVVYAYGLLYHLNDPAGALRTMARWCGSLLLLETGVSPMTTSVRTLSSSIKKWRRKRSVAQDAGRHGLGFLAS